MFISNLVWAGLHKVSARLRVPDADPATVDRAQNITRTMASLAVGVGSDEASYKHRRRRVLALILASLVGVVACGVSMPGSKSLVTSKIGSAVRAPFRRSLEGEDNEQNEEDQDREDENNEENEEEQEEDGNQNGQEEQEDEVNEEDNADEAEEEDAEEDQEEENDRDEEQEEDDRDNEAEEEQNEEQNDEDNAADEEEQGGDNDEENDQQQDEENEHENQEPGHDDFFDDDIDQFDDDSYNAREKYVDDFYAFIGDPQPPKLLPFTGRTTVGYLIVAIALTLGASGGIGGGGVVVPVYLLVMGLSPQVAIPIGAVTVLGGALSSTMINFSRRHPLADRPIIDWDLILVMEPLTLIGTILGTLLHRVLSEKLLVVMLVLLLSVTAHSTLRKAMRMYQAEKRYIRHLKAAQGLPPSGSPPRTNTWGFGEHDFPAVELSRGHSTRQDRKNQHMNTDEKEQILILNPDFVTLRSGLLEQEKFTPRMKIMLLVAMFSVLIFLNIMVGGGNYKSPWDIRCGSAAFWTVHVVMIAFLIASGWASQTYAIARHEIKDMVRYDYVHGDIKWDARSSIIYPTVFVAAGLFAGMFGIGGGVIIVPILLNVGVHPAVAATTSS